MNEVDLQKMEQRMIELETQIAFQDDTVHALNDMVGRQQRDILSLQSQMTRLLSELKTVLAELEQGAPQSPSAIEKPPH